MSSEVAKTANCRKPKSLPLAIAKHHRTAPLSRLPALPIIAELTTGAVGAWLKTAVFQLGSRPVDRRYWAASIGKKGLAMPAIKNYALVAFTALAFGTSVSAEMIYEHNAAAQGAAGPHWFDWYLLSQGVTSSYVANVAGTGQAATRMSTSTNGQYGFYIAPLFPSHVNDALSDGWRFETNARYEIPTGQTVVDRNFGLQITLSNRIYLFTLGHTSAGLLRAGLWNSTGLDYRVLTSSRSATEAFHSFAFAYDPAVAKVAFEFDGQHVAYINGLSGLHDNSVEWGNFGQQPGIMNYNSVSFAVGPFAENQPGDYNSDGRVDAADYTVWRDSLGSQTKLAADGNGNRVIDVEDYQLWRSNFGKSQGAAATVGTTAAVVPEPSTRMIIVAGVIGLMVARTNFTGWFHCPVTPFERRRF